MYLRADTPLAPSHQIACADCPDRFTYQTHDGVQMSDVEEDLQGCTCRLKHGRSTNPSYIGRGKTGLYSLPIEIVEQIASYIKDTNSTWNLRLTCRGFHGIIPDPGRPMGHKKEMHRFLRGQTWMMDRNDMYCEKCFLWDPTNWTRQRSRILRYSAVRRSFICSGYRQDTSGSEVDVYLALKARVRTTGW